MIDKIKRVDSKPIEYLIEITSSKYEYIKTYVKNSTSSFRFRLNFDEVRYKIDGIAAMKLVRSNLRNKLKEEIIAEILLMRAYL